jgi:signal transduction histidine kinase
MTFRYSLQSRIIVAFCLFGAVLGIVYATAVYISLDLIDDHLIDSRLNEEVAHFTTHYQRYNNYPRPTSPYMTAFVGTESMPLYVLNMIDGFAEGLHETYSDQEEYHIAIQRLPGQKKLLYLLYEVSALEFTEKRKVSIRLVLIAGVVLIIALGLWIGWLTSRKVIAPVAHLSDLVNTSGPDNLPTNLSKTFFDDEVGVLAKALEQAMRRVDAHVEREHRFGRYASHELRTPVTIIKGAVVLLKKKFVSEGDPAYRPLKRIERSVSNMENIIETLLWLSREDLAIDQNQVFAVVPVVRETIEQNRYLIGNKPIDIEFVSENAPQLSIPTPIFQIVLTNLIRNAIQHTASGKVSVIVRVDRVIVSDTGGGMEPDDLKLVTQPHVRGDLNEGFGIGLSIVKRLCDRLGWKLEIESEVDRGTTVELIFRTAEA